YRDKAVDRVRADFAIDLITSDGCATVVWRRPGQSRAVAGGVTTSSRNGRAGKHRLSRIKSCNHSLPAALPCNCCFGGEVIIAAVKTARGNAAIIVTDQDSTFLVDSRVKEI